MEVITLNKEVFSNKCTELISKTNSQPDIIVGILNGGGYIVDEIKKKHGFEKVQLELIKLQRDNWLKNNLFFKFILRLLPYTISSKLREIESVKARKSINILNLDELYNRKIDFQFNSSSKEKIKNVLIVDDAIDTGRTMFIVKSSLNKLFPNAQIKIAVISWTIETSIVKPDYYLFKNVLVRFPWSKDYKGKDFEKRVLVVDLDGTLYRINTFHYFIKYLILYCIKSFNIVLLFKLCLALLFRLFVTHAKMKYFVLKLLKHRNDIDYKEFVKTISFKKRVIPQLYNNNFDIKILATAAPSCYANIIAQNEKFHLCLGTDFPNSNFNDSFENSRDVKKENVMNYLLNENIYEIDTLMTDHIDDLPLMKLAKRNIIVEPNEKLIIALKQNSIIFEIIT